MNNQFLPSQFERELLDNILPYWIKTAPDYENGGFFGAVYSDGRINNDIPRTAVTCTRILWTFSHAYLHYPEKEYLQVAIMARDYLDSAFWDKDYQGLFWSIDKRGNPVSDHKQYYAQAFGIYSYSEFFRATHDPVSLNRAIHLYHLVEEHAHDPQFGGYIEGSARNFTPLVDMRLSPKDMNCNKSMNTLLHLIEAYTNLFRVWNDPSLRNSLQNLLLDFIEYIIDPQSGHFKLFLDKEWHSLSDLVSCGHEIEGSWLLDEAASVLGDHGLIEKIQSVSLNLAERVLSSGMDPHGGIIQEGTTSKINQTGKEWWPQAEAVIGFYNAYQLSGKSRFLHASQTCWNFIQDKFIDEVHGGWFKRLTPDGAVDQTSPKLGPWESSYHESRMCFEMIKRSSE